MQPPNRKKAGGSLGDVAVQQHVPKMTVWSLCWIFPKNYGFRENKSQKRPRYWWRHIGRIDSQFAVTRFPSYRPELATTSGTGSLRRDFTLDFGNCVSLFPTPQPSTAHGIMETRQNATDRGSALLILPPI